MAGRTTLFALLLAAAAAVCAHAQSPAPLPPVQLGLVGGIALSRSFIDYHVSGSEHDIVPGSQLGVVTDIPLGIHTAVCLGITAYTIGFRDRNTRVNVSTPGQPDRIAVIAGNQTLETSGTLHFITLLAMFRYRFMMAGINFCTPLTSHIANSTGGGPASARHDDGTVYAILPDITPAEADRSVMVEARIALDVPVLRSGAGSLHAGASVSYPFATMLDSPVLSQAAHVGEGSLPVLFNNFRMPSFGVNIEWYFGL